MVCATSAKKWRPAWVLNAECMIGANPPGQGRPRAMRCSWHYGWQRAHYPRLRSLQTRTSEAILKPVPAPATRDGWKTMTVPAQNHASNNNVINSNGAKPSIMQINIVKHTRTCSSVHGYITHSSTFRSINPNMHSSASQSLRNKQDTYHI